MTDRESTPSEATPPSAEEAADDAEPQGEAPRESGFESVARALDDLQREAVRAWRTARPVWDAAVRYLNARLRLLAFEAKENARLTLLRVMAGLTAWALLLAAWAFFAIFVYRLVAHIWPVQPYLPALAMAILHAAMAWVLVLLSERLKL